MIKETNLNSFRGNDAAVVSYVQMLLIKNSRSKNIINCLINRYLLLHSSDEFYRYNLCLPYLFMIFEREFFYLRRKTYLITCYIKVNNT